MMAPRSSDATDAFVTGPLQQMPLLAVPRDDRDGYVARLDDLCRAVAEHLSARYRSEATPP
jgi:hypothetical protein